MATRRRFGGSETGVAIVVMLYALSAFSVLSLTLLRNAPLEATLRGSTESDLHVVLFAGGAGSNHVTARLNLPTVSRLQSEKQDPSVQIEAPGPVGVELTAELLEGQVYAVTIGPSIRVCCDAGDGACATLSWEQQIPSAKLTPSLQGMPLTSDEERQLRFNLVSSDVAPNVELHPNAAAPMPFLMKLARVSEQSAEDSSSATSVSCTLQQPEHTLASGTLRLQAGVDAAGRVNRVSTGSVDIRYRSPR